MSERTSENGVLLEARHLCKTFREPDGRLLKANDHINLVLHRGETLGIIGESGCGKSTFVRMVAQLTKPSDGEILYEGEDITKLKGEALRQSRRHIQMVSA